MTKSLSTQLREARERKMMTIEQVARKIGVAPFEFEEFEAEPEACSGLLLLWCCQVLNCYCTINGPDGAFVVTERQEKR